MVDTDVLIATQASDLSHMLLLLPHSVVISYAPNHLHRRYHNVLAEVARLYYLPVFNATTPFPEACTEEEVVDNKNVPFQYGVECSQQLEKQPIVLHFGQLHNYMRLASTHVHIKKYRELSNKNSLGKS